MNEPQPLQVRSRVIKRQSPSHLIPEPGDRYVTKNQLVADSQARLPKDGVESTVGGFEIIQPPWDPQELMAEHRNSSCLRQNVDAYGVNIHGHGFTLVPRFDLEGKDADQTIADAMFFEDEIDPDAGAIAARREEYKTAARRDRVRAKLFFDYCCSETSFTELRRQMCMEMEITGHAYWEVRRTTVGRLAAFSQVPGFTVRALIPTERRRVKINVPIMEVPFKWTVREELREDTLWGQVSGDGTISTIFKTFGDTRIVSSKTGRIFETIEELNAEEPGVGAATELIQFKVWHPMTQLYGVPRWIGCLKHVVTARKAEFVNLIFFDNKSIPPLALLVSGGSVTDDAVSKIESYIEDEIAGDASNFHKILIIEAEPASSPMDPLNSGKVRIELIPMTQYIQDDGLFMKYMGFGRECVGESFRNPKIVRGATEGMNRATAIAALVFAESQVYGPERQAFDWWVNRFILPELDIVHWQFRSNSPVATDLEAATAIAELTKAGVLVPEESRTFTGRVFNEELPKIDAPWTKQPLQLTLAGALVGDGAGMSTGEAERSAQGPVTEAANAEKGWRSHFRKLIELCKENGVDPVAQLDEVFKLAEQITQAPNAAQMTSEPEEVTLRLPGPITRWITPCPPSPPNEPPATS